MLKDFGIAFTLLDLRINDAVQRFVDVWVLEVVHHKLVVLGLGLFHFLHFLLRT